MAAAAFLLFAAALASALPSSTAPPLAHASAAAAAGGGGGGVGGFLPPTDPPWPPTYDLSLSTITMQCNSSGYSSPRRGSEFGIVSYDWSNGKARWAQSGPMDCEEMLARQADMTKKESVNANGGRTRVFVYRNVVKALPWFSAVRNKLDDPAYAGFFLRFDDNRTDADFAVPRCAPENPAKCSDLYHDQEQTPQVPTPANPHPDGSCDPARGCDCGGPSVPCGEYLFDHRNGSMLAEFLISEVVLGPAALGRSSVDGLFLDDYWCSDLICADDPNTPGCPCRDPVQGPTEVDRLAVRDMGLTDEDVRDLTRGWNETMGKIERAVLDAGGYTWWLMDGQHNANAWPELLHRDSCAEQMRAHCSARGSVEARRRPKLFGIAVNGTATIQLEQDVAYFLLARGPYAWIGWGVWGMTWPFGREPAHGELPPMPDGVPVPDLLGRDFGVPLDGTCRETEAGRSGVFVRSWTAGEVALDCNAFRARLPPVPVQSLQTADYS